MKWIFVCVTIVSLSVMTGKIFNHLKSANFTNDISPRNIPTQPIETKPPLAPPPKSVMSVSELASEEALLPAAKFNEDRFRDRLSSTPLNCARCMAKTTRYFRAQDPKIVAQYFVRELHRIGARDLPKRTRLVEIADALHSDDLLPFWKDLAYRETPLAESERKILASGSPSPKSIRINEELASSVENLGAIGFHDQEAKRILVDIINNPSKIHRSALRHRALLSLRDADFNAAIRAVKRLPPDDELRARLKAAALRTE